MHVKVRPKSPETPKSNLPKVYDYVSDIGLLVL